MYKVDLAGRRFGKLKVVKQHRVKIFPSGQKTRLWLCRCDCGNHKVIQYSSLTSMRTKSCNECNFDKKNLVRPMFSKEDSDLCEVNWLNSDGYARSKHLRAHRVVMERKLGRKLLHGEMVDHIDRNRLNNMRANLRLADKSLNAVNTGLRADNSTGYTGVYIYWPSEYKKNGWAKRYRFVIQRNGHKTFNSKYYKTAEEANRARLEKLKEYIY